VLILQDAEQSQLVQVLFQQLQLSYVLPQVVFLALLQVTELGTKA
jgi:hypothetical protein